MAQGVKIQPPLTFFVAAGTRHISHSATHTSVASSATLLRQYTAAQSPGKIPGHRQPAPPWTRSPPGTTHPGPPNPVLHLMQLSPELKPGHRPPATPPPSPPRREARNELKPPAAFRITARRTQLRRPRPGAVGDLDPDDAVPGDDRDRDRLPGSTRAAVPDRLLPKSSLTSKTATSPHGCPGPSTSATNARAARARSARPASVTLSRTATLAITAPALPRPPRPGKPAGQRADAGKCTLSSAANVKPRTRPPRTSSVARPWSRPPSVAVRAKPTVPRTAPWPRFPSAMRPWTPQHDGLQRDKVTHDGTEQKRPASTRIRS